MDKTKILIVDDEKHIAELISLYLTKEGFETREVYDGRKAMDEFYSFKPELVLLDLMLPGVDGYQICTTIRKNSDVPIIILTARSDTFDKVPGLEMGADDYIVKPFEPKEMVARVKAVLRRYEKSETKEDDKTVSFDNLKISLNDYTVIYHGESLSFPPKELELLYFLAENKNQVFTREQLLDKIWGYEYVGDSRTVDVHIKRIREKLNKGDENWTIKTVHGVGYKFETR